MEISESEHRAFIGKKADYYIKKWSEMDKQDFKGSWNWGPFFFGVFWFAYRKMYLYAIIVLIILSLVGLLLPIPFLELAIIYPFWMYVAIYANHWYRKHVEKKILKIKGECKKESLLSAELARRGGVTVAAPIILFLIILVLLVI